MVKAEPAMPAELTVRAAVPVEVRVTDCADGVLRLTLPNERLFALRAIAGTDGLASTKVYCVDRQEPSISE